MGGEAFKVSVMGLYGWQQREVHRGSKESSVSVGIGYLWGEQ